MGKRNIFRICRDFIRITGPHLLSHHPHCRMYDRDVLRIGKIRLCSGCFIAYPTAIAVIVYGSVTGLSYQYPWYYYMISGIIVGLSQFISLFGRGERFRHLIKFFLGLGIGLTTIGVFRFPVHICLSILIFYLLVVLAGFFANKRVLKIENICEKCKYKKDWYHCPGLKKVHDDLRNNDLL